MMATDGLWEVATCSIFCVQFLDNSGTNPRKAPACSILQTNLSLETLP